MKKAILLLFLLPTIAFGQVTDIDSNVYKTVKIGEQVWMAANLRVSKYANGDTIPHITEAEQWGSLNAGGWCHYKNDDNMEGQHGKLYNWFVVNDLRNVCPSGWHAAQGEDWGTLMRFLEVGVAGKKMKSKKGWEHNRNGTNSSGFSGFPGGMRGHSGLFGTKEFTIGRFAYWWSSGNNGNSASVIQIASFEDKISGFIESKNNGYAVRCVKD